MQYMSTPGDLSGLGAIGQISQGPDGQLYQLRQTTDGLGNIGFAWLPLITQLLPAVGQLAQQLGPILSQNLSEYVPDQPQLGEVRLGEDGRPYQLTQTVDGLGNIGFAWLPLIAQALPAVAGLIGSLFNRGRSGTAGLNGYGEAYDPYMGEAYNPYMGEAYDPYMGEAYDPYMGEAYDPYMGGMGWSPDDLGLAEDELGEDSGMYDLRGLDEDFPGDLRGFGAYPDDTLGMDIDGLDDFGADPDDLGIAESEPLDGLQGYMREANGGRIQGYVPGPPSASPQFVPGANSSPLWSPLW